MENNYGSQQTSPDIRRRLNDRIKIIEMDEKVKFATQMEANVGPVILINKFNVNPAEADQFLRSWTPDAAFMKRQPGFISAQIYRGIMGSGVFLNMAVWESTEHFKRAFNNPEFLSNIAAYPAGTISSPHLIKKIPLPGICVD